ncbi:MAG: Cell division protein ZapA [Syntrophus sp. PtaU1.Bin005]|jgi:cell division protein ZapA|uniref:cell division protein ZapA n=1 Tax=Syntrophus TaxID=43773 RepID=UPI0009C4488F|nr:cell division protein ZapA [Syntrophus sp. (in: bacteria)]OPY15771.1 MAG: Cell division protein ZapA [Syntrophus sp. PtaB.Bin138]OPY82193.1 MAG: Cell division protein ZapA [Syntrophus sp. PtaU1.Bin005]
MKKDYYIKILGQEFTVLSDSGDEHVKNVMDYINHKVMELENKSPNTSTLNIAILVALNIADEYMKLLHGDNGEIFSQIDRQAQNLINLIDEIR